MREDDPTILTPQALECEAKRLRDKATALPHRLILGIAGIAGSGKSTLAQRLVQVLNALQPNVAEFIPMDGFHLPNAVLDARGWRERKGAAHTYDAEGYVALLRRYANPQCVGGFPEYCRQAHEPASSPRKVTAATRVIVTEGQYLLCPEHPWSELGKVFEECWWLDVPEKQARAWLMKRDTAVGRTPEQAEAKYQRNDRLNTEFVLAARRTPGRVVKWPP